jgi:hypothetical protein
MNALFERSEYRCEKIRWLDWRRPLWLAIVTVDLLPVPHAFFFYLVTSCSCGGRSTKRTRNSEKRVFLAAPPLSPKRFFFRWFIIPIFGVSRVQVQPVYWRDAVEPRFFFMREWRKRMGRPILCPACLPAARFSSPRVFRLLRHYTPFYFLFTVFSKIFFCLIYQARQ